MRPRVRKMKGYFFLSKEPSEKGFFVTCVISTFKYCDKSKFFAFFTDLLTCLFV